MNIDLLPIELDELIEWHKTVGPICDQTDDFLGARIHRDRYETLLRLKRKHLGLPTETTSGDQDTSA